MKKKPDLDDMDVVFDPTPLTADEKRQISEYIRQDKAKRRKNTSLIIPIPAGQLR